MELGLSDIFKEQGYVGSIPVFTEAECQKVLQALRRKRQDPEKGFFIEKNSLSANDLVIAQFPPILSQVSSVLGRNSILWGASLINRVPGQVHPWHSDVETADDSIRSVSVWIGLEGTTENTSLQLISCSHLFGQSLQEARSLHSIERNEVTASRALELAQGRNPLSRIETPCQRNGEAVFFDGRIWHGSHNLETDTVRTALLLQYISTDSEIRVPDPSVLDWPFQYLNGYQPEAYLAHGTDTFLRNKLMKLPPRIGLDGLPAHQTAIHSIPLPIPENPEPTWNQSRSQQSAE